MKKIILSSIVAMGMVSALHADMTIYGKANVFIDVESADGASTSSEIKSDASRFGVKGSTKLDNDLTAIYQWETSVDYDSASGDALKNRNTFIGLKGNFGAVKMGALDTPMKTAQGKVDLFNDVHDMKNVIGEDLVKTENRASKVLAYSSPKFNNIQLNLATAAMDDNGTEKLGKALSTSIVYGDKKLKKTPFYAAVAYDKDVAGEDKTALRVVLSTKVQNVVLGALAEKAEAGNDDQMRYLVSAAYKLDKTTLKLQHVMADEVAGNDRTQTSFGVDYKVGKKTKLFAVASQMTEGDDDTMRYSAGIEHKFSTN